MDLQQVLTFTTDNWIALLAAAIAGLSALYSRWAVREAKQANKIELHAHQKELFIGFKHLSMHLASERLALDKAEVEKFTLLSITAPLYVPPSLATAILEWHNACLQAAELRVELTLQKKDLNDFYKLSNMSELPMQPDPLIESMSNNRESQNAALKRALKLSQIIEGELMVLIRLV